MGRTTNQRVVGMLVISWSLLGFLWLRCAWLQVIERGRYEVLAESQHEVHETLRAHRGTIYDRLGRVLAVSAPSPSVFVNARRMTAKHDVAQRLARLVDRDAWMIQRRLERDRAFVWVARQVEPRLTSALLNMRDAGVGIVEEPTRRYPQGALASPLMGFVDIDQRGLEGLELAFNGVLRGWDGWRSTLRDAKGDLLIGPWAVQAPPIQGLDLVLTIDSVVQQVAEETLDWGVKKYHAKGGSILVMDPATGALWAMAVSPSYDANAPAHSPPSARRNRAVTDIFEPGSIFKIVTASALLEEGRITPDEPVFCENGAYPTVAHHVLHDHQPHGMLSFHDVIKLSSNIGTAKAAQRLKPEELFRYIQAFGFGRKTGIDVPGEVSGMVHPPERWSKLSPFIIPIGQEVGVTPIQLAVMTAVIANGGCRVHPYLVDRIQAQDGTVVRSHTGSAPSRILSEQTASRVQEILVSVVESGTGQLASVPGLTVAGKTGTAQKLEPNGRYSHSRFVASFVGCGPVPRPRVVIVVNIDEPHPLYFGGVVAAPLFRRVMEQLASYWGFERTT